jgi:hypothetical protein
VAAVQGQEPLAGDQAEPEKRGDPGVVGVLGGSAENLELRVLQHIGRVDASLEPSVQSQTHHAAQPVAVSVEQLSESLLVPGTRAAREVIA